MIGNYNIETSKLLVDHWPLIWFELMRDRNLSFFFGLFFFFLDLVLYKACLAKWWRAGLSIDEWIGKTFLLWFEKEKAYVKSFLSFALLHMGVLHKLNDWWYNTTLIEKVASYETCTKHVPSIFSSRMTIGVVDFSKLSSIFFSCLNEVSWRRPRIYKTLSLYYMWTTNLKLCAKAHIIWCM